VEHKHGQVILQPPSGDPIRIHLNQLGSADQIYVGRQSRPAGAPALAPPPGGEKPIPPALEALFGKRLVDAKGKRVSTAELAGKTIGIYFSASWCPPCRAFTPQLVAAHEQLRKEGKPFEVVLVGHDRSEADMKAYMKSHDMPWLAIPFGDKPAEALKKKFGISGIPALVIVDAEGKTLSANARGDVARSGARAFDAW
jgi:thiol-disulfide isomerase/thioredoxin